MKVINLQIQEFQQIPSTKKMKKITVKAHDNEIAEDY